MTTHRRTPIANIGAELVKAHDELNVWLDANDRHGDEIAEAEDAAKLDEIIEAGLARIELLRVQMSTTPPETIEDVMALVTLVDEGLWPACSEPEGGERRAFHRLVRERALEGALVGLARLGIQPPPWSQAALVNLQRRHAEAA